MTGADSEKVVVRTFTRAFEQMCNFVAVAKTGDPRETIRGLVQLCLFEAPDEHFDNPASVADAIETLFGVRVPSQQTEDALHVLEANGVIRQPAGTNYVLSPEARDGLAQRIDEVTNLEERAKTAWLSELDVEYPALPHDVAWSALRAYLCRAFRRHGIQAVALLDPGIDTPAELNVSLSSILDDAIREHVPAESSAVAREAISDFFAELGTDVDRARYITQLADGAFNFFTLEVSPELSAQLRERLHELTLFLDTNFLFGILGLHHDSQVEVSHELLRAIKRHKLPFKLRYHETTLQELRATIGRYGTVLRSRAWSATLSRAAAQSRNLSGIEQIFHDRNALSPVDVEEFLRPFDHVDQLLDDKGISIYRPHEDRKQTRVDLYHEYKGFLKKSGRGDKVYETVMHDATVLETTRHLRSNAPSSLHAGALLISCDYFLYRFDWGSCGRGKTRACVLLPNVFWQILRPFVPTDQDFEKAFAETFALPEFRALGSGGAKACSKMMQILATYKDVPEETALNMLSNDVLLDQLSTVDNDGQFAEQVQAAFVEENKHLLEEKAALEQRLERAERDKAGLAKANQERLKQLEKEKKKLRKTLDGTGHKLGRVEEELKVHRQKAEEAVALAQTAEESSENSAWARERAEKRAFVMSVITGLLLGAVLVAGFELCVHLIPWVWMKTHPNALPLQLGISAALLLFATGLLVTPWRKWCWGTGTLVILVALLSPLSGGTGTGAAP